MIMNDDKSIVPQSIRNNDLIDNMSLVNGVGLQFVCLVKEIGGSP